MNEAISNQPSLHLEEVWKQRSSADQLSPQQMLLHHCKLAILFLFKSPLTSILSIFCVATVIFILGLLLAVQRASIFGLHTAAGKLQMSVFVRDNCSDQDWTALDSYLGKLPGLVNKRKLDKAAALVELKKILSDSPTLLNGLEEDNPLPASFELSFEQAQGELLPQYAIALKNKAGVEAVTFDGQLVRVLSELGSKLRGAGRFTSILLIGLTLFLIATTIRISLYHESDEIEIMNLVGAYHNFIQAPFIIGGAIQGLLGSIIACIFLTIVETKIMGTLHTNELLHQASISFSLLGLQNIIFISLLGVGAGIVGSYLASRRIS